MLCSTSKFGGGFRRKEWPYMMKYFAILSILIFSFYLCGYIKKPKPFQWMDRNYTTAIKGFSILTVVWAHCGAMLSIGGIQFIAGVGVALFLICSGYGLEISYEKNGLEYFWKKRLLGVFIPFWVIEFIGLFVTGRFNIGKYLMDFVFIKPATNYGWFMGYIVVCYLIFYIVKRFIEDSRMQAMALIGAFTVWFVLESVFFINPDIPFLRARQMLSFPCGVLLAMMKGKVQNVLTKKNSILILIGGIAGGGIFMAITQLHIVKEMPYLASNILSLLTCLPMAVGILAFGKAFCQLFENKMLMSVGTISYEIYLVHAFVLNHIKPSVINILILIVITYVLAYILQIAMRKIKNDRFNGSYLNKK